MNKEREALKLALEALENIYDGFKTSPRAQYTAIAAIKEALEPPEQEPVGWLYPEGLKALEAGKCWTLYGTKQDCDNSTPVYLHPQSSSKEPYAWVTFTPYGEEDDVWYENPEGHLIEGWTYKPLYDTTPPKREWVGLSVEQLLVLEETTTCAGNESWLRNLTRNIEARLKELNA